MIAGSDAITREQMNRIYGCIRIILIQRGDNPRSTIVFDDFKMYIKLLACEEGYPFIYKHNRIHPQSFAEATQNDAYIINVMINQYADLHGFYLYESDEQGPYPSYQGLSRDDMIKKYPEIYYPNIDIIKGGSGES